MTRERDELRQAATVFEKHHHTVYGALRHEFNQLEFLGATVQNFQEPMEFQEALDAIRHETTITCMDKD